ncbi:MAG: hypothetical protein GC157_07180 [Frankiales bacterium]|nr:hypothetical protein [Frankiales bacterium]
MAGLEGRLDDLIDAASDLSPAWPEIGKVWSDREERVFATGSFGRWAPLKVVTVLQKLRDGATSEPLVHTGILKHELTSATPRSQGPRFAVYGPARGAVIDYAKFHVRGQGVPQRHPVPRLTPTERRRMVEKISDHLAVNGARR